MRRLLSIAALLSVGLACQAPFGEDRHDLTGDRIAAVATSPADGGTRAEVALVVGGALWTDAPVAEAWYPSDSPEEVDAFEPPDVVGPRAVLPQGTEAWTLVVTFPSGAERRALLTLPADGATALPAPTVALGALDLDFDEATPEQLAVDARADLTAEPAAALQAGAWGRLTAYQDAPDALDRVRWMSTAQPSTFLELDAVTTDWATGTLLLDDLEIEEATPMSDGVVTLLALALASDGSNAVAAFDVAVGETTAGARRIAGRHLGVDAGPGLLQAVVEADDTLPAGIRLRDPVPAATPTTAVIPCGGDALLDPNWLLNRRCLRSELVGLTVTVDAR